MRRGYVFNKSLRIFEIPLYLYIDTPSSLLLSLSLRWRRTIQGSQSRGVTHCREDKHRQFILSVIAMARLICNRHVADMNPDKINHNLRVSALHAVYNYNMTHFQQRNGGYRLSTMVAAREWGWSFDWGSGSELCWIYWETPVLPKTIP